MLSRAELTGAGAVTVAALVRKAMTVAGTGRTTGDDEDRRLAATVRRPPEEVAPEGRLPHPPAGPGAQQRGQRCIPVPLERMAAGEPTTAHPATHVVPLSEGPRGCEMFEEKTDKCVRAVCQPRGGPCTASRAEKEEPV